MLLERVHEATSAQFHDDLTRELLGLHVMVVITKIRLTEEPPRNKTRHGLAKAPPAGHRGQYPLVFAGQILQKHSDIQDQIAARGEANQGNKEGQRAPVGHGAGHDAGHGAGKQGDVKGGAAANDVGAEAPEERTEQQAGVDGNVEGVAVASAAEFAKGRRGHDGLDQRDLRVDRVAEAVEEKEFEMVGRPANFVNGLQG